MNRGASTLIACAALVLGAGCGSSASSTSGSASSSAPTTSTSAPATGASTPTGSSTPSVKSGELQPTKTPKFAVPSPSAPVSSGIVPISYRNIAIAPDTLRVKVGSTIKWTNFDTVAHNVTSEHGPQKFASKTFGQGKTFELKATEPGVINYECTIHPASMNGTIEVVR
jgi:plastocyanin